MDLSGARVWIVGASSGIGAALAAELAGRGAHVAVSGRRQEQLDEVAGGRLVTHTVDVTDATSLRTAAAAVRRDLGGLDAVVYSAGLWQPVRIDELTAAPFEASFDTNVLGLVRTLEAVLPGMREQGVGRLVGVASVAGYRGLPDASAYGATKAAMIHLLESWRGDLGPRGITVQTVCPGFVRTPMTARNRFPMPFLVTAERAAREIADGMAKDKPEIVFPRRMLLVMKTARLLPVRVWDAYTTRQGRRALRRRQGTASG